MTRSILHLLPNSVPCGARVQAEMLAERARAAGAEVMLYALPQRFADSPLALRTAGRLTLCQLAKKLQPSLVHIWGEHALAEGLAAARCVGARAIVTLRHFDPWKTPDVRHLAMAHHVVVNQPGLKRAFAERGCETQNWVVIPDGVEPFPPQGEMPKSETLQSTPSRTRTSLYEPTQSDPLQSAPTRAELLARYALPENARLVFCIGPVQPWKRWKWAIWSIDSIVRLYPDVRLVFIGDGNREDLLAPQRALLERFVHQYQRAEIVHFLGDLPHEEVRRLLPLGTLFWSPQSVPGSGLAMLEAMAAGVPVVTTATPEIDWLASPEICEHVPVMGETIGIAAASHRLLSQPERTAQMTQAAQQWVRERFSCESAWAEYAKLV